MSYHGTPWQSMQNAVDRAKAREIKLKKINYWYARKRRFARKTEAYQKVCEETARLGLKIAKPRTELEVILHMNAKSRRDVTLPGPKEQEKVDERTLAEDRMMSTIRQCVHTLCFHLTELSQVPNPRPSYRNRVNQKALADLITRLANSVQPVCRVSWGLDIDEPRCLPLARICIDCGGPATTMSRGGQWYCEDCAP